MTLERAGRYRLGATLGQGGMGAVYRAVDEARDREVALKRLLVPNEKKRAHFVALFQREFHTLAELAHPSVIQVYDYGVDEVGPYYTMELLQGDDLRELSPLPYRQACMLLHDVASSLALLHARRLVHRDVTARNVRAISPERAKLMDFGALVPMGQAEAPIGTPAYVAPEAVMMQALDGRTDLYSLGVLLYYALTARLPYLARAMAELRRVWLVQPPAVHELVPEVPRALSELISSLISFDRSARPRDAGEVMERLAAIAGFERSETVATSRAYLTAPTLIGRGNALRELRGTLVGLLRGGHGGGLMLTGPRGVGRSRMLDAAVLEAKVLGVTVLRTSPKNAESGAFGAARAVLQQLADLASESVAAEVRAEGSPVRILFGEREAGAPLRVTELDALDVERSTVVAAGCRLVRAACRQRALVIAVDDVHLIDEASVAFFVALLEDAARQRLLVLTTASATEREHAAGVRLLQQRSDPVALQPLDTNDFYALTCAIFGKVPNTRVVAERLHQLARGLPRDAIALAEHMVEQGSARYEEGGWVLPPRLDDGALPQSFADALRRRLQELSPRALDLARSFACAGRDRLQLDDFLRLDGAAPEREVYAALDELVFADVLVTDGYGYLFGHEGFVSALLEDMSQAQSERHHLALARMHETGAAEPLELAYHRLMGGQELEALEIVESFARGYQNQGIEVFNATALDMHQLGELFAGALHASKRADRGLELTARMHYFILTMGVFGDSKWYYERAPDVEEQLLRESGWNAWQALDPAMDPQTRVFTALQQAQQAFDAAPPKERSYPPAEAIRHLVLYSVASIAVGVRTADWTLLRKLPGFLEPFKTLTPIVEAIWCNCRATAAQTFADYEVKRELYHIVLERISDVTLANLDNVDEIREAVRFGVISAEVYLGLSDGTEAFTELEHHPRQRHGVFTARSILAAQRGDWAAAAELRKRAEQTTIEGDSIPMFGDAMAPAELAVYALGDDLGAVKHLLNVIERNAEQDPGWVPALWRARGEYERLRGKLEGALDAFRRCMQESARDVPDQPFEPWYEAAASIVETLCQLGRLEDARGAAQEVLRGAQGLGKMRYMRLRRAHALVLGQLGELDAARSELDALIAERRAAGTTGVFLALLHEARAQVAAWEGDAAATEQHIEVARAQYMHCEESGFSGRFQRLREALRRAPGMGGLFEAPGQERSIAPVTSGPTVESLVEQTLAECADATARARRGLSMLGDSARAGHGYLYLMQSSGVELAATLSSEPVPDGLYEFVMELFTAEAAGYEQPTMTAMLTAVPDVTTAGPSGVFQHERLNFRPLWIRARLAGESSLVGIAMIAHDSGSELPAHAHEMAAALGSYLLRAGDAHTQQAI